MLTKDSTATDTAKPLMRDQPEERDHPPVKTRYFSENVSPPQYHVNENSKQGPPLCSLKRTAFAGFKLSPGEIKRKEVR